MIAKIAKCDIDDKVKFIKDLVKKSYHVTWYPSVTIGGFYPIYLREAYDGGHLEKNELNELIDFWMEHIKSTKSGLVFGFGKAMKKIEALKA